MISNYFSFGKTIIPTRKKVSDTTNEKEEMPAAQQVTTGFCIKSYLTKER